MDPLIIAGGLLLIGGFVLKKQERFAFPPLAGELVVKDPFGSDGGGFRKTPHPGVDLRAAENTPVFAVDDGDVVGIERETTAGNIIRINTRLGRVSFMHLNRIDVTIGDKVKGGEQIGLSGATGNVTGPHLHIELRPVGVGHAVDPAPFFL